MQAKSPAVPNDGRRFGQQDVARRAADAFPGAFQGHQDRSHPPMSGESQRGDRDQIHAIADDGDGPVGSRPIGQASGKEAQAGGQHFTDSGNEPYLRGAGAEVMQERPDDTAGSFIRYVGEHADDAQANDEADRAIPFPGVSHGHLFCGHFEELFGVAKRFLGDALAG